MKWHPKVLGFSFWMGVLGCLALAVLAFMRVMAIRPATPAAGAPAAPQLEWLTTLDGERRGFVIASDLRRDGAAWELWGPGPELSQLNTIAELRPGTLFSSTGFGVNGGYWDEARQAVGICAGERGIHGARSHPGGFALAGDRAWIGALTARIRLTALPQAKTTSRTLELALNPAPLPRRAPYLLDPAAEAAMARPEGPAQIIWLKRAAAGPLRFNTTETLTIRRSFRLAAGQRAPAPPHETLVLVRPEAETGPLTQLPGADQSYRLTLALDPVQGVVRMATCAGPRLVKGGKIAESLQIKNEYARAERTWRTAVGCDASGHRLWVLMLARGRDGLPGATLREAAQTLLDLGATEALNLDGGSSASVWYSPLKSEFRPLFPLQSGIHHAIFLRKALAVTTLQQ